MEINELMMLTDNQIDYSGLSEAELKELALGDELFLATSALGELASKNKSIAANVAKVILSNSRGDRYLQAAALETLFQCNRGQALDYISKYAMECVHEAHPDDERYILNTIMEIIIENQSDFHSGLGWSVFSSVSERIKKMNSEEFSDPEVRDSFLNLYAACILGGFILSPFLSIYLLYYIGLNAVNISIDN